MECIFCKVANGQVESDIIYQDENLVAFNDISPKAPCHVLIIPKKHIATLNDVHENDTELLGRMVQISKKLAKDLGVSDRGYRILMNCNEEGGQAVYHIHLHLLGGRAMSWPPG